MSEAIMNFSQLSSLLIAPPFISHLEGRALLVVYDKMITYSGGVLTPSEFS
jgi:hypothetical protein